MVNLDNCYGFLMAKASEEMEVRLQQMLTPYHINARHFGLMVTIKKKGNGSQKEIGDVLKIDRTTMVGHIDYLESLHYVKRIKNQKDRRSFSVVLTKKGEEIIDHGWEHLIRSEDEILYPLSSEEKKILKKILLKINSHSKKKGSYELEEME